VSLPAFGYYGKSGSKSNLADTEVQRRCLMQDPRNIVYRCLGDTWQRSGAALPPQRGCSR
jgi:hypothetical protein